MRLIIVCVAGLCSLVHSVGQVIEAQTIDEQDDGDVFTDTPII